VDIAYKLKRLNRWSSVFGLLEALRFEAVWSCKLQRVKIRVPGYRNPFLLRRGTSDLSVFETVFVDREFEWYVPTEPRFIIDGGANVGFSTAFFANRFPGARVIAVEPSNENVSMLRTNCQGIENITVVEGGLWPVSGFLRIANPNDPTWSFRCEVAQENAEDAFPAYSVGDIIDRSGFQRCDLLKLDIEGAEEQLFSESRDWLARVDAILVEVHGGKALAAVKDACPVRQWEYKECGEKLLILPRESQT
jgi:FkbM family methyltransferase